MSLTILLKEAMGTIPRHQAAPNQRLLFGAVLTFVSSAKRKIDRVVDSVHRFRNCTWQTQSQVLYAERD